MSIHPTPNQHALVRIAPETGYDVDLDIRYATPANLAGRPLYRAPVCLLAPAAAQALARAVDLAAGQGLRLRLFDGYRPPAAQWGLWQALPDPEFVADPRLGSNHTRGVALDLTLADAQGQPLDLGTDFDDMSVQAHHANPDIAAPAQRNRFLLLGIMASAGWAHYPSEWWHYQLPDAHTRPLIEDGALAPRLAL